MRRLLFRCQTTPCPSRLLNVLALLVGALLAAIIAFSAWLAYDGYRIAQSDKTVDRELILSVDDPYTLGLFAELDPVWAQDSLRVVTVRFQGRDFALALWLDRQNGVERGVGQVVIADPEKPNISKRDIRIPADTVRRLFAEWDKLIATYHGSRFSFLDGNALAFDRRSGGRVRSGSGNNPCHYDRLGDLLARRLGPTVPELNDLRVEQNVWTDQRYLCDPSIWGRMWHNLLT